MKFNRLNKFKENIYLLKIKYLTLFFNFNIYIFVSLIKIIRRNNFIYVHLFSKDIISPLLFELLFE